MPNALEEWQFDVASDLLKRVLELASGIGSLGNKFPISTEGGKPDADLRRGAHDVIALRVALLDVAVSLRDSSLEPSIANALHLTAITAPRLHGLARSITVEDKASRRHNRAWSWSGVAAAYDASVRDTMTEPARCGWEVLIDGTYLHDLDDAIHALTQLAMEFVMAPPHPEHVHDIVRRGSAHEEHVRGRRRWCALCGWLDAISRPTETQSLYHFGSSSVPAGGPYN
jgi:hypothetical protein